MDNPFSERLRMKFASNKKKHVTHIFPGPGFVVATEDGPVPVLNGAFKGSPIPYQQAQLDVSTMT